MRQYEGNSSRELKTEKICSDLVITGGGLAGVCCAITAAREDLKVTLIQDRPVLGGNASSEVRLWALGATSHMGNNNRWSREGGVIDEIVVENLHRNREGNPVLVDALLLDKVLSEPNITLLLDTSVFKCEQNTDKTIRSATAFCSQNSTLYEVSAPLFCDASGDGILGYLSGAPYRIGAEQKEELDEPLAPDESYGELLGHTIYFYSRDTGKPVRYKAPDFALKDIEQIPRFHQIKASDTGCAFWWLEYGGRLDTVHDTQKIKLELLKISYGIWDYIKNSGKFPEADNLTLEWVGMIPGKRESRRFEGDYLLSQSDIVNQTVFEDAVSFGGWAIDLHPADGVYSERPPCNQYHSKGIYQIPWRCYYSRSISNLFIAGRLISSSHVAMGSTRVMMTGAHGAQAIAIGAVHCLKQNIQPKDLLEPARMKAFQNHLKQTGQYIPFHEAEDPEDLMKDAVISASSTETVAEIPGCEKWLKIQTPYSLLLPVKKGKCPRMTMRCRSDQDSKLKVQLRSSEKAGNYTPEVLMEEYCLPVAAGTAEYHMDFDTEMPEENYAFLCLVPEKPFEIQMAEKRLPGFMSLYHEMNPRVAKDTIQTAPAGSGLDSFEFWLPKRRPEGALPAIRFNPPLSPYAAESVRNGRDRPYRAANAWLPDSNDQRPGIKIAWEKPRTAGKIILIFDTDQDHAMETVQMGHQINEVPSCVRHFRLSDQSGRILAEEENNYQTRKVIQLEEGTMFSSLTLELLSSWGDPSPLMGIRVLKS